MAFNPEKYLAEEFEDRVIDFPVPDLAPWCDGEAVFKLRGLTGVELAQVRENLNRRKAAQKLLGEAESKSIDKAITDACRVILGLVGEKIPEEHAKFIDLIVFGCVEPKMDIQAAAALGKNSSIEFEAIARQIMMLTGQGRSAKKKPLASGEIQTSEPA
jgi:hypothetical protein